jgi:hypothetical protein
MDECDDDCTRAVCDTLIMRTPEGWKPVRQPEGVKATCVFCRMYTQVHHYTPLAMAVCGPCNDRIDRREER